jgi:nitroreductase
MDFWEVIESRYSLRDFDPSRDVAPEEVEKILRAAIRAPSAGNLQPWFFVVVREAEKKEALARAALDQRFIARAPVVVVVCADPDRSAMRYAGRGVNLYCLQDTAAATENLLLAAVALGLGGCWVGAFNEEEATRALDLPSHLRPVAIVPLGHATRPRTRRTPRRDLKEVRTSASRLRP